MCIFPGDRWYFFFLHFWFVLILSRDHNFHNRICYLLIDYYYKVTSNKIAILLHAAHRTRKALHVLDYLQDHFDKRKIHL